MHKIDHPSAALGNEFTEGDPSTGLESTIVTADWLNAVQNELATFVTAAGIILSKPDNGQVLQAFRALNATLTQAGTIELATDVEARGFTDAVRAITPSTLKQAFKGSNQNLGSIGYQLLPGNLLLQWGNVGALSPGVTTTIGFALAFTGIIVAIPVANTAGDASLTVLNYTNTTFQVKNNGAAAASNIYWLAIGSYGS